MEVGRAGETSTFDHDPAVAQLIGIPGGSESREIRAPTSLNSPTIDETTLMLCSFKYFFKLFHRLCAGFALHLVVHDVRSVASGACDLICSQIRPLTDCGNSDLRCRRCRMGASICGAEFRPLQMCWEVGRLGGSGRSSGRVAEEGKGLNGRESGGDCSCARIPQLFAMKRAGNGRVSKVK
jgi:hypothetical protein